MYSSRNCKLLFGFLLLMVAFEAAGQAERPPVQAGDTLKIRELLDEAVNETDLQKAAQLIEKARYYAEPQAAKKWYIETYSAEAVVFYNDNQFDKCLSIFNQITDLCQQYNYPAKATKNYNNLSATYSRLGLHDKAYEACLAALALAEKTGDENGMANAYQNMADEIYSEYDKTADNFAKAKAYYEKAIEIYRNKKQYLEQAGAMNNLAVLYMNANQPTESYQLLQATMRLLNTNSNTIKYSPSYNPRADVLTNFGWVQLAGFKQNDSAIYHIEDAIRYCHAYFPYESVLSRNYLNLTDAFFKTKNFAKARKAADSCLFYSIAGGDLFAQAESYKNISVLDSIEGNSTAAYKNLQLYTLFKDSIADTEKVLQLQGLNIKYETAKKAAENEALKAKVAFRKRIIIALAALAAALGFGLFYYYRTKNLQKKLFAEREAQLLKEKALQEAIFAQQQELLEKEKEALQLDKLLEEEENKRLKAQNELQNRQLTASSLSIEQQNKLLTETYEQLYAIGQKLGDADKTLAKNLRQNIKSNLQLTNEWDTVVLHFEKVHPGFFKRLSAINADLTQNDLKHCAYIKLNLATKEIASLLGIDARSVRVSRYRLKKKLSLNEETDLLQFIAGF
jgi:DNA-binding CsgD family transcriptional regulator